MGEPIGAIFLGIWPLKLLRVWMKERLIPALSTPHTNVTVQLGGCEKTSKKDHEYSWLSFEMKSWWGFLAESQTFWEFFLGQMFGQQAFWFNSEFSWHFLNIFDWITYFGGIKKKKIFGPLQISNWVFSPKIFLVEFGNVVAVLPKFWVIADLNEIFQHFWLDSKLWCNLSLFLLVRIWVSFSPNLFTNFKIEWYVFILLFVLITTLTPKF